MQLGFPVSLQMIYLHFCPFCGFRLEFVLLSQYHQAVHWPVRPQLLGHKPLYVHKYYKFTPVISFIFNCILTNSIIFQDLPGISLSYKPPSAAHLEINSEREENLPQQGERDALGGLSNQIHAYEETLRKLRLARGSGTSSGQPDVDPAVGTKQTDSSCSQSFLFSQLRYAYKC